MNLELAILTRVADQQAPRIYLFLPLDLVSKMPSTAPRLLLVLDSQTRVLMPAQKVLYPGSYLPALLYSPSGHVITQKYHLPVRKLHFPECHSLLERDQKSYVNHVSPILGSENLVTSLDKDWYAHRLNSSGPRQT